MIDLVDLLHFQKYDIQESFKRDISGSNNNAKNTQKVEDNAESSIQDTSVNSIIETPTSIDTVVSSEETDKERLEILKIM